jgi:hypothetical protein
MENDKIVVEIEDNDGEGYLSPNLQVIFVDRGETWILRADYTDVVEANYEKVAFGYTYKLKNSETFEIDDRYFGRNRMTRKEARDVWEHCVSAGFEQL